MISRVDKVTESGQGNRELTAYKLSRKDLAEGRWCVCVRACVRACVCVWGGGNRSQLPSCSEIRRSERHSKFVVILTFSGGALNLFSHERLKLSAESKRTTL